MFVHYFSCIHPLSFPTQDLHRTGCTGFCGTDAEGDRVVLKRVLLAYARWNKSVGYCQGFNVLAALILEVVDYVEDEALKVSNTVVLFVIVFFKDICSYWHYNLIYH